MSFFNNLSIKKKLVLVIMVTTLTGLLCASLSLMLYDRHTSRQALIQEHQILLQVIAHRSTAALAFRDQRGAQQNLEALAQQESIVLACLYDAKNKLFLGSPDNTACPSTPPDHRESMDDAYLHIYEDIMIDHKRLGSVYAKASLEGLNQKLERLSWVTAMIVILVSLLALLMTSIVQKLISKPIVLLSRVSQQVSKDHDYSKRAHYDSEDELGLLVRSFNSMMSTIEKAQDELKNLAFKDGLTGLPNRRAFVAEVEKCLESAKSSGEKMALFLVDLDGFKAVNDQLGHEAGDRVLTVVSERFQDGIRRHDIAARLGGDEFTLLIRDAKNLDAVAAIANKICKLVDEPIYYQEQLAKVSASIGVALIPEDGYDAHGLFKVADEAMYLAKEAGKNGFVYGNEDIRNRKNKEHIPDEVLQELLDRQAVKLWVEPQFELDNKNIMGGQIQLYQALASGGEAPLEFNFSDLVGMEVFEQWQTWFFHEMCHAFSGIQEQVGGKRLCFTYAAPSIQWQSQGLMSGLKCLDTICAQESIRFFLAINAADLAAIQSLRAELNALEHIALSYDINVECEFDSSQLADYQFEQIRFLNKLEDGRVEDKRRLGKTRAYMNMILIELCQQLRYQSVGVGVSRKDQMATLKNNHCQLAQGPLLGDPVSLNQFISSMSYHVPMGNEAKIAVGAKR